MLKASYLRLFTFIILRLPFVNVLFALSNLFSFASVNVLFLFLSVFFFLLFVVVPIHSFFSLSSAHPCSCFIFPNSLSKLFFLFLSHLLSPSYPSVSFQSNSLSKVFFFSAFHSFPFISRSSFPSKSSPLSLFSTSSGFFRYFS